MAHRPIANPNESGPWLSFARSCMSCAMKMPLGIMHMHAALRIIFMMACPGQPIGTVHEHQEYEHTIYNSSPFGALSPFGPLNSSQEMKPSESLSSCPHS